MSIREYKEGEFGRVINNFVKVFKPTGSQIKISINFNNWFKGNLEGINTDDLCKILKFRHLFSWNILQYFF